MGYYINKSDIDLKDLERLKDSYNHLCRTIDKLIEVSADIENDELFLKLNKITTKVLQAKFELADDVLEPFERHKEQNDL